VAVVMVTHDQDEAFVVADRIAVMAQGTIHQIGTAEELYARPETRFVAQFVGIANFVPAMPGGNGSIETQLGSFSTYSQTVHPVEVLLRPEQIEVAAAGIPAVVEGREFHGHDCLYVTRTQSGLLLRIITPAHESLKPGDAVRLRARAEHPAVFPAD
jgi:ABC-type Fe3+/spermidine/putrescine transport system ATPase subunit